MNNRISYLKRERTTYIETKEVEQDGVRYTVPLIKFMPYKDMEWLEHGFSTRLGGVSEGCFQWMNLSFSRGDLPERVMTNHRIMGRCFGVLPEDMVYSYQTHTTRVLRINREHAGMGLVRERNFAEVDGFVTKEPGLLLITSYADCVPLFFADRKNHVIGLSHSGWRGTVNNMARATVDKLWREYGTRPEDIVAFIGPSICRDCYEVGADVAGKFYEAYKDTGLVSDKEAAEEYILSEKKTPGRQSAHSGPEKKFYLNLHAANRINMERAGILPENIYLTDICTCCNPELLFSHRASKGQRGALCGYMMIKK